MGGWRELATPLEGVAPLNEATVAKTFRELMKQWRAAADVPRDKGQKLWKRFKKAHDLVFPRCDAFFTDSESRT